MQESVHQAASAKENIVGCTACTIDDFLFDYRQDLDSVLDFMRQSEHCMPCRQNDLQKTQEINRNSHGSFNCSKLDTFDQTITTNMLDFSRPPLRKVRNGLTSKAMQSLSSTGFHSSVKRQRISGKLTPEQRQERRKMLQREYQRRFREKSFLKLNQWKIMENQSMPTTVTMQASPGRRSG
jgi:hypothetical protein